jgi:hypothetical protein
VKASTLKEVLDYIVVVAKANFSGTGGFLKYTRIIGTNMVGQEDPLSCAIAYLRQFAKDKGIILTEDRIRKYAGIVKGNATYEKEMSEIAKKF